MSSLFFIFFEFLSFFNFFNCFGCLSGGDVVVFSSCSFCGSIYIFIGVVGVLFVDCGFGVINVDRFVGFGCKSCNLIGG